MRKNSRKAFSLFLAVVLVVGILPGAAFASAGYSDVELCSMARQHYTAKNHQTPPRAEVDHIDGNYTVIRLYEVVVDDPATGMGHTSTWDWYYIDRDTGKGYDLMNEPVDLTPYATGNSLSEGSIEYEELRLFLHQFHFSWCDRTFDSENITTQERNLLQTLLFSAPCYAGPTPNMDWFHSEADLTKKDPLGKWDTFMYSKWDATQVEWVLENVFNCSQTDIDDLRSSLRSSTRGEYYLDGYYYSPVLGVGDDFKEAVILDIAPDGSRYYITYELHGVRGSDSLEGPYFAIVERKQISGSGKGYWSLYYHSTEPYDIGTAPDRNDGLYNVNLPFYSGLGNKTTDISVEWGWSLFNGPAFTSKEYETYDNRLAITALALSAAAEHSQKETKTLLTSVLGFEDYDHKNYDSSADQHPAVNFACKETVVNGQTQYIFAIVVRGSSNLDDAWTDISSIWGGFDTAASHLHAQLGTFMGNTSLPDSDVPIGGGGRVKFFVTGHSLGGAIANIMAKNLSDVYGAENVFAYTFASPKVISADKESGNGNIYNIINREDWVPASPPNLKGRNGLPIGFSRHDFAGIEQKFAELTNGKSLNSLMKPSMLFWESHNQLWYPHAVETYMSFLLALSNDASIADRFAGGASHGLMGGGGWCPVDLDIYVDTDKGPKLVGRIKDNVIDDSVTTGVILRVDGDKKYFYFPLEGNYTIKLTGTGTDTMTYFVQEMDLETSEPIPGTGVEFQNVSLMPGKQFSSDVQISQETITEIGTNLYVLDSTGTPEKEVLPDGKGTEIPYEPKPAVAFTDVPADAYYHDAVYWAAEKAIVKGTSSTKFTPKRTCTTAEIITFLWRAAGKPSSSAQLPFTVNKGLEYAEEALRWAYEKGMIDADFNQTAPCTRASAVKYIWQAGGSPAVSTATGFTDVPAGADYAQAVAWAVSRGIVKGTSSTTFSPNSTCTRAQIVTFLYRDRAGTT